jgi:protein TonB
MSSAYVVSSDNKTSGPLYICGNDHPASSGPCAAPPSAIHIVTPALPEGARQTELQGVVVLSLVISITGAPHDIRIVNSVRKELDQQAMVAVKQWRFTPGMYKGQPVPVKAKLTLDYQDCQTYGAGLPSNGGGEFFVDEQGKTSTHSSKRLSKCNNRGKTDRKRSCPPFLVLAVLPEYTEEARQAGLEGTVVLSLVVNEVGRTGDIRVLKSLGKGLDEQAIAAVKQWRYQAALYKGEISPVTARIELEFGRCKAARDSGLLQ